MTPQPRHVEAAEKIADDLFYRNHASWADRRVLIESIALALAEAENRAAWRGYELGTDWADEYMKCKYDEAMAARDKMSIEYGPRPTTENQA